MTRSSIRRENVSAVVPVFRLCTVNFQAVRHLMTHINALFPVG